MSTAVELENNNSEVTVTSLLERVNRIRTMVGTADIGNNSLNYVINLI